MSNEDLGLEREETKGRSFFGWLLILFVTLLVTAIIMGLSWVAGACVRGAFMGG